MVTLYHFTNSEITEFRHTKPKRGYSQATGKGIYFTTDYNKGMIKYGNKSKYCYMVQFNGANIVDLGEFDSMYFNGSKIHSCELVSANFKRCISGEEELPEPQIKLEQITTRAFNWLKKNGVQAVTGMYSSGYCCPEFCVLDESMLKIVGIETLHM